MAANEPSQEFRTKLNNVITANYWQGLIRLISNEANTVEDVFQDISEEENNILHSVIVLSK